MSRILVICDRYPADLTHGLYLRVHHFCRELGKAHECFLVDFEGLGENAAPGIFAGRASLPARPERRTGSRMRGLRWSDARYLAICHPDWFRSSERAARDAFQRWQCDMVYAFAPPFPELAMDWHVPKVLDWADSSTLAYRREISSPVRRRSLEEKALGAIRAFRQRGREAGYLQAYDLTTTIGESDRQVLLEVSRVEPGRIRVMPNGVSEAALRAWVPHRERARSLVFWGNLGFPPNATAVQWFYDRVFLPYLAPAGVPWHIVGGHASPNIEAMNTHPLVKLHGYVDNLFAFAAGQGVMVNPMVQGGGLKNKVLEAFALGLPVSSTSMGVDALPVTDGEHCLIADDPRGFADATLHLLDSDSSAAAMAAAARRLVESSFRWSGIGQELSRLLGNLGCRRRSEIGAG